MRVRMGGVGRRQAARRLTPLPPRPSARGVPCQLARSNVAATQLGKACHGRGAGPPRAATAAPRSAPTLSATRGSRREPSARRSVGAARAPSGAARRGWVGGRAGLRAGACAGWRGYPAVAVEPGTSGA